MIMLATIALAADTPDWHAAQARGFLKKGWIEDAEAEVAAGLVLDPHHLDLNALCVDLSRQRGDIDGAIACAAAGAAADSGDLDTRARLSQVEGWLRANFGWVDLAGPEGVVRARLDLVATSMQLDGELQVATSQAAARLAAGVRLPAHTALPIGDYTVLGVPVTVLAGQTRVVTLPTDRFVAAAGAGKRFELAIGVVAFSGYEFANQAPGLTAELAISAPAGPLRVGVGATWDLRAYSGVGLADATAPNTAGGVLRLGVPLEIGSTLSVTPAFALRGAMLPGLELACAETPPEYACAPGRAASNELPIYANGFGVAPLGELAVELHSGRVVLGLRGSVGHMFALLPDPGEVLTSNDGLVAWRSAPPMLEAGVYSVAGTIGLGW
ncbi:hypothetical protein LBMAG42_29460 [Deltaproteobacteria bacterium]|nr:hypothetical protein LBMAG42_29460 [Deltaproteobacteria bacterium]